MQVNPNFHPEAHRRAHNAGTTVRLTVKSGSLKLGKGALLVATVATTFVAAATPRFKR